ncbi:DUF6069 family protein [Cryptosporangium arvum]|uniref:Uncharacterized protein n=1 Tax=Cryptosporangium arvum DSM 44712 TaxID=927661 RepID=A0A010YHR6_9ACTN|nr:DUF6069 family protein [Cryptosporangium arvum]EXG79805.1 hypothetical protein CryarDRAFT_0851 [Cryptosporangium arvum DSM 44712]
MSKKTIQRGAAVGAAAVCALVLWAGTGGHPVADGRTVGAGAVLATSVVAGLAGWALLAVLERFTRHAYAIWATVATLVYGFSLIPSAGAADGAANVGTLLGLHTIVYVVLMVAFGKSAQSVRAPQAVKPVV